MIAATVKMQKISFFRPGGMFAFGLVVGLAAGAAVLLVAA
jgi:hypothetical protein